MTQLKRSLIFFGLIAIAVAGWRMLTEPATPPAEVAAEHVQYVCKDDKSCLSDAMASLDACVEETAYDRRQRPGNAGEALNRTASINIKLFDTCMFMKTSQTAFALDAAIR